MNIPPDLALRCPSCGESTTALKCFRMLDVFVFAVLFVGGRGRDILGCGACVRRPLLRSLALNLVTANVLWPIVVLPWNGLLLLKASRPGHSKATLALLEQAMARRAADAT